MIRQVPTRAIFQVFSPDRPVKIIQDSSSPTIVSEGRQRISMGNKNES